MDCHDPACVARREEHRVQEERRRQLLKRLIMLQEEERRQVARELHEGAGQMLTSLLVGIKLLENAQTLEDVHRFLPDLKNQTWEALETLRLISVNLRPSLLEDLGLVSTLRSYVRDFGTRHQMEVFFTAHGEENRLPPMTEVTVFRIVQEALVNAGRYSHATQVSVTVAFGPETLEVRVDDNGVGMDTATLSGKASSGELVGLLGMQERADFVGGACRIESTPGCGVTVHLTLPIQQPAPVTP